MADGTEDEFAANEAMICPRVTTWSVGHEACIFVEFSRGNDHHD
jgi:hypothetical protein